MISSRMILLGWAFGIFALVMFFYTVAGGRHNPNTLSVLAAQDGVLRLLENADGHFLAEGKINDAVVTFLLDTGATRVAVSDTVAERAGLERGRLQRLGTAAGDTLGYSTRIGRLEIGDFVFSDIKAVIIPEMGSNTVLLGMNALGRLHLTQQDGELEIRAPAN